MQICHSESVLFMIFVFVFPSALEEKRGGEQYDISLPSVINFHIVGLLEICLSLNLNALLLLYYIMHFYLWGRGSQLRGLVQAKSPPTCFASVHTLRSIN